MNNNDVVNRVVQNGRDEVGSAEKKSEEFEAIMSKMPGWVVRRGSVIVFGISAFLLVLSHFIKYPDIVQSEMSITFSSPPVKLIARSTGKIQRLFTRNNEIVRTDDPICLIENPSIYEDVVSLKMTLATLDCLLSSPGEINDVVLSPQLRLGEIQPEYVALYLSCQQYTFFCNEHPYSKRIEQFEGQLKYVENLDGELQKREKLLSSQLTLEREKFSIDSTLYTKNVLPQLDYYNSQLKLLTQSINSQTNKFSVLENKIQQAELTRNILELNQSFLQTQNDLRYKIYECMKKLDASIASWEQKYLIKAPINGKVAFFKFWKENQYVELSEAVAIVIPSLQDYTCKARVPVSGAGKVRKGQKVLIKLNAYPYQEFGAIIGQVTDISDVPLENFYSMEVHLSNGLTTTRNKKIPSYSLLDGTGEVLTSNKTISERIFERILNIENYNP